MRPAPAQSPGRADAFCYILAFGVESGKASKRLLALTLFVPVTYNSRSHPEILSILIILKILVQTRRGKQWRKKTIPTPNIW